jgi:hypothetical protein
MQRRSFIQSAVGAGLLSQSLPQGMAQHGTPKDAARTRFYTFDYYSYRQGDQSARLNKFLMSQMPLLTKRLRCCGVFTGVMTPHAQTTLVVSGFGRLDDLQSAAAQFAADPMCRAAQEEAERGDTPPFDALQRTVLAATDFSPEVAPLAEKPKSARYFELRIYHSPTTRQLRMVQERFSSAEIQIFHRSGVHPILYANTFAGPDMSNLTYFMPFASLADREKAWSAFSADPEWVKARDESIAHGGQIVDYQNISLWRATAYSPIQ